MDWDVKHYPEYWGGKKLAFPEVPRGHPKFARCMTVGNLIFASGCVGQDTESGDPAPAGVADQVNLALDHARQAMETAGGSMENIIKTFFLIRSLDDYQMVRKTETEYYEKHAPSLIEKPPSATLMVIPSLARPEFLAEYEVIGVIDRTAPDWGVTYYPEFWAGRELAYPHVPKEHAKFARTQVAGEIVIVSGCQALDHDTVKTESDDFREQSRIVLEKIKIGMEESGGSLNTVAKTNVFLKNIEDLAVYQEEERLYYEAHAPEGTTKMPVSTAFVVTELPRPEFLIETEAIGVAGDANGHFPMIFSSVARGETRSVSAGQLIFLEACDGSDPTTGAADGDAEQQITVALEKVRAAMEAAGSSMDNVVKTVLMLKNLEDYPARREAELAFYEKYAPGLVAEPPVSTFTQLPMISAADSLFQIDVMGVL